MPRRSAASLAVQPTYQRPVERLIPPVDMPEPERRLWLDLVAAAKPDHFQRIDEPLLAAYVRACVLEQRAAAEIGKYFPAPTPPMLATHKQAVRTMYALAMRLRVSPQARQPNVSRGSATSAKPMSYYERWNLENPDGGKATRADFEWPE